MPPAVTHDFTESHLPHFSRTGSPEIERHIAFRDYMIAHPVEAQMYNELKERIAEQFPYDMRGYIDGKDSFIKEHQAKGVVWWKSL